MERKVGVRIEGDASSYASATQQAEVSTRKLNEAAAIADVGMKKMGVSAGQTAQAIRQLPMQVGDFFSQVSAGGNPMTAFIQQGLQVKDSFGGAGNAFSYFTSLLSPARLALGAVGAAAGVAALAAEKGRAEWQAYEKAIILTGNAAGVTAGQLDAMARKAAGVTGATQGASADVLTQLVSGGQTTRANLGQATAAAISLQRSLGIEVEKTVANFTALGRDPLQAAIKLNEQFNFLTLKTYAQIKALSEHKREAEAAAVAQAAFADMGVKRSTEMEAKLGSLQKAWRGVTDFAKGAWDAMLGLGREKTLEEQLAAVEKALAAPRRVDVYDPTGQADRRRQAMIDRRDTLQESIRLAQQAADREAESAQRVKDKIESDRAPKVYPWAIRDARSQYRNDFLRSEKDAYGYQDSGANVAEIIKGRSPERAARVADLAGYDEQGKVAEQNAADWAKRVRIAQQSIDAMADANQRAGVEEIRDAEVRGKALIDLDEAEMRKRIDTAALGAEEIIRLNEEVAVWREQRERELTEKLKPEWRRMLDAWQDSTARMKQAWDDTVTGTLKEGENAWVRWAQTGKLSVQSLVDFVIAQGARESYRGVINALAAYFNGGSNPNYSNEGRNYPAPSSSGTATPSAADGIKTSASAGSSVGVTIINQTGTPMTGSASRNSSGGLEVVLAAVKSSIADDINNGTGEIPAAMQSRFGLRTSFSNG